MTRKTPGSHRTVSAEVTLARIAPLQTRYGITRLADVTGLDHLGIPTYCSIRPGARTLQVCNGKGARAVDAQVSALMEAIELAHGEQAPARPLRLASLAEMAASGEPWSFDLPAHARPSAPPIGRFEWVRGIELTSGVAHWLPASTAWLRPRQVADADWSGLASGNTLDEATLHALYEVLERHVLSGFVEGTNINFASADVIALPTIDDPELCAILARVRAGGVTIVLLRANTELAIHATMAVLLDDQPLSGASAVNVGYGAHLSPAVAAMRAITEAAQSRLTFIHGAREDLRKDAYEHGSTHLELSAFFAAMQADTDWDELIDLATPELESDLALVLDSMKQNGLPRAFQIDMSQPDTPFAVTKVFVPGAKLTIPV